MMENTAKKKEKTYQVNNTYSFLSPIFSDTSGNGHANPAFKLKTPQEQRKVRARSPSTSLGRDAVALRCGMWFQLTLQLGSGFIKGSRAKLAGITHG